MNDELHQLAARWDTARTYWERDGKWKVVGECPDCGQWMVKRTDDSFRAICTNYGGCEYSVG